MVYNVLEPQISVFPTGGTAVFYRRTGASRPDAGLETVYHGADGGFRGE